MRSRPWRRFCRCNRSHVIYVENGQKRQVKGEDEVNWKRQNKPLAIIKEAFNAKIERRGDNADEIDEKGELGAELIATCVRFNMSW